MRAGCPTNRWSEEETATLLRMRGEEATDPQIAAVLGRTVKSVECRWQYLGITEEGRERRRQGERRRERLRKSGDVPRLQQSIKERLYRPTPEMLAERDMRMSLPPRDLTAALLGDPPPGYSALERRA